MNPDRPKIEKSASKKYKIQPAEDLPKPPHEAKIPAEEIEQRRVEDEQNIKEVKSSLGLESRGVADDAYERAENFEEGIALLRDKIKNYLAKKKNLLVALSGKTGSGKTTFADDLRGAIAKDRIDATVVSTDNFYLPNSKELNLKKLQATISKLQRGETIGNLTPAEVILVEGVQTIEDKTVGQKPDIRTYITIPAHKRFAARLHRDGEEFVRKLTDTEFTPEFMNTVQRFEADPSMEGVDVVVDNDRENPSEPELYIAGDSLVYSVPGGINGTIKITPDRIQFLEQVGIQRK